MISARREFSRSHPAVEFEIQIAGVTTLGTNQKFFNDFSKLVWISIYAKSLKSLANLAETVQTDPGSRCSREAANPASPAGRLSAPDWTFLHSLYARARAGLTA